MNRRLLLLAVFLAFVPACGRRTEYPNEASAKTALMGKSAHDVAAALGAPDSVVSAANLETPGKYTEYWTYSRIVRDASGDLKTLQVYLLRSKVVSVVAVK